MCRKSAVWNMTICVHEMRPSLFGVSKTVGGGMLQAVVGEACQVGKTRKWRLMTQGNQPTGVTGETARSSGKI